MKARGAALPPKPFFSPRELAALADIHPSTVLDQIHSGKLYAVKLSDRIYRIPRAVVVSTLYPETIGEPVIRRSPDPAALMANDRRRRGSEGTAARSRSRRVVARSR